MMKKHLISLILGLTVVTTALEAKVSGKLDLGPAHATMKVYDDGVKIRKKELNGAKFNGTLVMKEPNSWYNGLCFKPDVTFMKGGDEYASVGLGIGYFIPLSMVSEKLEKLSVTPYAGGSLGRLEVERTSWTVPAFIPDGLGGASAGTYRSARTDYFSTASIGMDIGVSFTDKLLLSLAAVYKFNQVRSKKYDQQTVNATTAFTFNPANERSAAASHGWSWAAQLDYYVNDNWSVGLAYGYEGSKMKEKLSSKLDGFRLSAGYTF
ncbi:MAG: autotransporter outer membrane beta-barrel domain-containing protein [Chlamydiales bacterium]|nr:autotransporter outer membrane beta-barrel domain-containing protein [Chlamydiales bacterium]